jgi:uncharacterized protein
MEPILAKNNMRRPIEKRERATRVRPFHAGALAQFGLLFLLPLASCTKEEKEPMGSALDRGALLRDVAANVVRPAYASLAARASEMESSMAQFEASLSLEDLLAVHSAWQLTMDAWQDCEAFKIGPQYTTSLNSQIANWPEDQDLIESEIAGSGPIDAAYINSTGSTRKGLSAAEYLLFGTENNVQAVHEALTTAPGAVRRRTYLASLCTDVRLRSHAVNDAWRPDAGNYEAQFVAATQSDISGSLNLLVNAWIEHIEWVRREKVQLPGGIDTGTPANGDKVENGHSQRSLANIRRNVQQWKALFSSAGGTGLDDALVAVGATYQSEDLAEKVRQELDLALANCDAIQEPLHQAVINLPAEVNELYLTLKRLTVLTKVDVASNLGVIVTFSDNDGD